MKEIRVIRACTGSSVGTIFGVCPDLKEGFYSTDCGRIRIFQTVDAVKRYWSEKFENTKNSFDWMSYTLTLAD